MRVAALVADARCCVSGTRTCSDASVCCRRPGLPVAGASVAEPDCRVSVFGARAGIALAAPPEPPFTGANVGGAFRTAPEECAVSPAGAPIRCRLTGRGAELPVSPCTIAAATAMPSAAGTTTNTRRRDGRRGEKLRRGAGADASTRERSTSGARSVALRSSPISAARRSSSASRGASPASSASRRTSIADIDLLLQVLQGATQPSRARGLADPEHTRGTRAVELEQDTQREHLALGRRELAHRLLDRARQSVHQVLGVREVARVRILAAAAARLGSEPVDRDRPGDAAEPRARRAAPRVEAPPRSERLLERLRREILGGRAVAGEQHEVAIDGVELLGRDLGEARPWAEGRARVERGRNRVHALYYGAAAADRHIVSVEPTVRPRACRSGPAVPGWRETPRRPRSRRAEA